MQTGMEAEDAVQPQWSALFAGLDLSPGVTPEPEVVVGIETGREAVRAVLRHGTFEVRRGTSPEAQVTLSGPAPLVGAVLAGVLTPDQATDIGLRIASTPSVLAELLDTPPSSFRSGATP
jgi:hypothetical protein